MQQKVTIDSFTEELIRQLQASGYAVPNQEWLLQKTILEDYDIVHAKHWIERRFVARILHGVLLFILQEPDEKDWMSATVLQDLYDCRTCVNHIAQIYAKGVMPALQETCFGVRETISMEEAVTAMSRAIRPQLRVLPMWVEEKKIQEIPVKEVMNFLLEQEYAMLIDVRTPELYEKSHLPYSISIPLTQINKNPYAVCENRRTPIILYCEKGYQSRLAGNLLQKAGFQTIYVTCS